MNDQLRVSGVLLTSGDLAEISMAYRRLPEVRVRHDGAVRVPHALTPSVVTMADAGSSIRLRIDEPCS